MPDHSRELPGDGREQLFGDSFDTSAFVMSNSVRSRSRSRTASCLARKDSTATANSLATRSRNASSAGLGSIRRRTAEPERAQPIVSCRERDQWLCAVTPAAPARFAETPASGSHPPDIGLRAAAD